MALSNTLDSEGIIINQQHYNISNDGIFVRGFKDNVNEERFKILTYPGMLYPSLTISESGVIRSISFGNVIETKTINGKTYINLTCSYGNSICMERFFIDDLVAYNFIEDSKSYLERGCHVIHKDGDIKNNHYTNLMYGYDD